MQNLPTLLLTAWLLPLVSFTIICIGYSIPQMLGVKIRYSTQKYGSYISIGAIVLSCLISMIALFGHWLPAQPLKPSHHGSEAEHAAAATSPFHLALFQTEEHREGGTHDEHNNGPPPYITGDWYALGVFGNLRLTIGYYIDTLTVLMFAMVTLVAACVHVYAYGYMHDELHDYE